MMIQEVAQNCQKKRKEGKKDIDKKNGPSSFKNKKPKKKKRPSKRNSGDSTPLGKKVKMANNNKRSDKQSSVEIRREVEHDDFLVMRSTIILHIESTPKKRREKFNNIPNDSRNIELDVKDVARMGLFEFAHEFTCNSEATLYQ